MGHQQGVPWDNARPQTWELQRLLLFLQSLQQGEICFSPGPVNNIYFHNLKSLRRNEVFLRMFTLYFLLRATVGFEVTWHFYQGELIKNLTHKQEKAAMSSRQIGKLILGGLRWPPAMGRQKSPEVYSQAEGEKSFWSLTLGHDEGFRSVILG